MNMRRLATPKPRAAEAGYTFVELLVVTTILLILASAVMPLAQVATQRQREAELRRSLREVRTAIDQFRNAVDQGRIPTTELEPENQGYPPDLDTLVEGISAANDASGTRLRFRRRLRSASAGRPLRHRMRSRSGRRIPKSRRGVFFRRNCGSGWESSASC